MSNLIFHNKNDYNNVYKDPLKFIDSLDNSKHIVLCYENPKFAKTIQFRFIKKGLLNGEICIYTIFDDDDTSIIEKEMINNTINVECFNKRGLLTIFKISDLMKHPKGVLKGSEEILDKILSDPNPSKPFRLVIRMIDKLNTKEQIKSNMILEKYYHSKFDSFNGLILCSYDVSHYPINMHEKWIETILENHHSAIFVTGTAEEGIAFDM
jgi:hypothetical protein